MIRRRLRRVAAVAVLVIAGLAAGAPAQAATAAPAAPGISIPGAPDCKHPPAMADPRAGIAAIFDPGPEKPRTGNPFSKPPTATMYDQYRWAGYSWVDYDPGCVGDYVDVGGRFAGSVANLGMTTLSTSMAASTALMRFAYEPAKVTGIADSTIGKVATHAFGGVLFPALIGVSIMCLGALLVIRHRRNSTSKAADAAWWAGIIMLVSIGTASFALTLGQLADQGMTRLIGAAGDAAVSVTNGKPTTAADALGDAYSRILLRTWQGGTFGRTDSPAIDKFTPDLFAGGAMNFVESDYVAAHPEAGSLNADQKEAEFRKFADDLKKEDPAAYDYLAGNHNLERLGYVTLGWISFLAVSPLVLVGGFLIVFSLLALRVVMYALPLIALIAVIPKYRVRFTGAMDFASGALVNALVFVPVTLVWIVATAEILSPQTDANPIAALIVLLVVQTILWRMLKPWRRARHAVDGAKATAKKVRKARDNGRLGGSNLTPEQLLDLLRRQGGEATRRDAPVTVVDSGHVRHPDTGPVALALAGAAVGVGVHELADRATGEPRPDTSRVTPSTRTATEHGFVADTTGVTQLHDPAAPMPPASAPRTRDGSIPMPGAPTVTATVVEPEPPAARRSRAVTGSPEQAALPAGDGPVVTGEKKRRVWVPSRDDAPDDVIRPAAASFTTWTPRDGEQK